MRAFLVMVLAASAAPLGAEPSVRVLCDKHADALLAALDEGRYEAATTDFDDALRTRYPSAKLRQDHESLPAKYGKRLGRGRPHDGDIGGHGVVMVPLIFERGTVTAEIRCDAAGAISDLRLLPTQAMDAP